MKITANSLRIGNVIQFQNQLWVLLKREHVKPGKGGAFIQAEMKNIKTGTKTNTRFSSVEDVEIAHSEEKRYQFQYLDQNELVVMDNETFEQLNFPKTLLGDSLPFLQEGMELTVSYCNDNPISIALPETAIFEVTQADAVVKGQTASASYKPAIIDNGVRVMVPPFVGTGDRIVVRCEDGTYVERAKK